MVIEVDMKKMSKRSYDKSIPMAEGVVLLQASKKLS
jgi:hypothetical protein